MSDGDAPGLLRARAGRLARLRHAAASALHGSGTCPTSRSAPALAPPFSWSARFAARSPRSRSRWASARTRSTSCAAGRCGRAIPDRALVGARRRSLAAATAIGVYAALAWTCWLSPFVAAGASSSSRTTSSSSAAPSTRRCGSRSRGARFPRSSAYVVQAETLRAEARCGCALRRAPVLCAARSVDAGADRAAAGGHGAHRAGDRPAGARGRRRRAGRSSPCAACVSPTMGGVNEVDILQVAFAISIVLAAIALVGAALDRLSERFIFGITAAIGAGALAGWVLFALDPRAELAVPAAGLTTSLLAAAAAIGVRRGVVHARTIDAEIAKGEARLDAVLARGADERAAELERVLARARADSLSLLAEQERRIADAAANRARRARAASRRASLRRPSRRRSGASSSASRDGARTSRARRHILRAAPQAHAGQQRQLSRTRRPPRRRRRAAEADSEVQRGALVKLREELAATSEEQPSRSPRRISRRTPSSGAGSPRAQRAAAPCASASYASASNASRPERCSASRRSSRTSSGGSWNGSNASSSARPRSTPTPRPLQFADAIKRSREDAAQSTRARARPRAAETFAHQAEGLMSEQLANVGQASAQRLERRLAEPKRRSTPPRRARRRQSSSGLPARNTTCGGGSRSSRPTARPNAACSRLGCTSSNAASTQRSRTPRRSSRSPRLRTSFGGANFPMEGFVLETRTRPPDARHNV